MGEKVSHEGYKRKREGGGELIENKIMDEKPKEAIAWIQDGADEEEARVELRLVGKVWTTRNHNKNPRF